MFSLKKVKKALVLLCFRSKKGKKHWFYCVFAQNCWKTIGFTSKEAEKNWKTIGFTVKPAPGNRATGQPGWSYGFGVWVCNTRSWIRNEEPLQPSCLGKKALVLLCFRSKMLKKQWFYCVFAPKCWKNIGFTVFSLQNVEKALVLQTKRP